MAIIHHTTLKPSKLDLLTTWLPARPWYAGDGAPELTKAGGFRLDDPEGEVGIEFMVVGDADGVTYLVPLTYRGAPLDGAEHALVGTMEHGVLGKRWAYDGCHDPVLVAELFALVEGRAQAQAQSIDNTPDHEIARSYTGPGGLRPQGPAVEDKSGTEITAQDGTTLRLHRRPGLPDAPPPGVVGHVSGHWTAPDGTRVRALFAELR
ncbi:maltokinase N-terminal cap-like domain-containing protein [Streptomyces sp. P17]|uniref:maltokinase N-terminal cap-like domain-containing protein n=1 Tax=Streptomyces sp. P17 TaxID=3074716 RepID=UPI0028F45B7D|nr:1,4-alpha-glucan branching protein [Streptomyces sp. P17]MDT9697065.1 1,4-alpha-glucan branching protein [Streptomyces sp. P17]